MTVTECRKLLSLVEKGVTRRSTQPLQNAVLLERDGKDRWRFTASDLEFVDVSTWEDGFDEGRAVYAIAVPPKVLKSAIKGKPGGTDLNFRPVTKTEVDLHMEGATKTVTRLKGLSAEDFETIPASEGRHSCDLSERDLATLQHVAQASSTDETRPTLTGVLFRFGDGVNHPEVCATDTHRLAKSTLDAEANGGQPGADYVAHRSALAVLTKAAKGEGTIRASFAEGTVEFLGTNWRLRTRRVEGQFPNYLAVIPDLAEAAELLPVLQRVARTWGVPILRQPCEGNGWSNGTRVNVDPSLPDGVTAQTLVHELAHHLLKHRELAEKHGRDRMLFEGEAEAVKVVVLRHLGIDTRSNGAAHLRAHGADADLVKRSAGRIVQTAKEVIEAIEEHCATSADEPAILAAG